MPQVDLEAFVSSVCAGNSDRKIACESTLPNHPASAVSPADFPPESYFLSKDDQLEWLSDNAFFDRKDSQRGNSGNLNSNPNSQRFLLKKSKASIIGLPKPQKTCFNEAKQQRRKNGGKIDKNRIILKRVGSRMLEPSSPKVSCIGRVRSKRERSRSCRMHRQKSGRVDPIKEKANRVKKPGFLASFKAIFKIGGGCKDRSARGTDTHTPPSRTRDIRCRLPKEDAEKSGSEPVVPGLGGMTRFVSGRRADLLGGC